MIEAIKNLSKTTGVRKACVVLGVPRANYYRFQKRVGIKSVLKIKQQRRSVLALNSLEEKTILDFLNSERFVDRSPGEIYSILLDEGTYICSERTMYRLLKKHQQVHERRKQAKRLGEYIKPELLANQPNRLWSWDITKLKGASKWNYYHLYVIIDVFSRYVVGWMVADRESSSLAGILIKETCKKQDIQSGDLTLHADRGSSMKSKLVAHLLSDLGVTKTHSRPYTSDDNPFSESHFKTLKYCPEFPEKFGSIEDAKSFCRTFFSWYNNEHRHSGINRLTPRMLHCGEAEMVLAHRNQVLMEAYLKNPKRFRLRQPSAGEVPKAVWINPPPDARPQEKREYVAGA